MINEKKKKDKKADYVKSVLMILGEGSGPPKRVPEEEEDEDELALLKKKKKREEELEIDPKQISAVLKGLV